jgi:hypothetical protein
MNKLKINENKQRYLRLNSISRPHKLERSPLAKTFISPSDNTTSSVNSSDLNFIQILGDVLIKNVNLTKDNSGSSINNNKFSQEYYNI